MTKNKITAIMYTKYFIIIFLFTFISQFIINKVPSLYKNTSELLSKSTLSFEDVKKINYLIEKEIFSVKQDTIAIFFYNNDYNSRSTFSSDSIVSNTIINDVLKDPEYSRALEYHKVNECYQQSLKDMDKSSSLYEAIDNLNISLTEENGYYSSCPIYVEDQLVGYVGTFFTLDIPGRPSIRLNRLKFLTTRISNILQPYF